MKRANETQNREELIDTINQLFSIFRVNYHNQFYAAFNDAEQLNSAKKLWLSALDGFQPTILLLAAQQLVSQEEYLPTLSKFIALCDKLAYDLPDEREAYLEACQASTNIAAHEWTHPIVYHSGKACGWSTLRAQSEAVSWPVFQRAFADLSKSVREGTSFQLPRLVQQPQATEPGLSLEERKEKLAKLKAELFPE